MNDDHGDSPITSKPRSSVFTSRLGEDLSMGLKFYSRVPLPFLPDRQPELNRIALALPFASLLLGIAPALLLVLLSLAGLPGIFAAGLAIVLGMVVTGAMAEDGLADAADGLWGGLTATRRLEIMRDSTHGTYGIAALAMFLLLRVVAIGAVATINPFAAAGLWLAAAILGRSGSLWLAVVLPPARADGLSAAVGGVTRRAFVLGAAFAAVIAAILASPASGLVGVVVAIAVLAAVAAGWTALCQRLVGGQTGDLIGALQALLELAALTVFLVFI